eukprot:1161567-Pelagomonas_calceolata.AAC.6
MLVESTCIRGRRVKRHIELNKATCLQSFRIAMLSLEMVKWILMPACMEEQCSCLRTSNKWQLPGPATNVECSSDYGSKEVNQRYLYSLIKRRLYCPYSLNPTLAVLPQSKVLVSAMPGAAPLLTGAEDNYDYWKQKEQLKQAQQQVQGEGNA